jgi:hypothetical protein
MAGGSLPTNVGGDAPLACHCWPPSGGRSLPEAADLFGKGGNVSTYALLAAFVLVQRYVETKPPIVFCELQTPGKLLPAEF